MTEYICHFCNTKHNTLEGYAQCVAKCNAAAIKQKEIEQEAKRRAEQEAEKKRKESARNIRRVRIKELEAELNKLYAEEYNDSPDARRIQIESTADLLRSVFPEIFGGAM